MKYQFTNFLSIITSVIFGIYVSINYLYFPIIDHVMSSKIMVFSRGYISRGNGANDSFVVTYIESQIIFVIATFILCFLGYVITKSIFVKK